MSAPRVVRAREIAAEISEALEEAGVTGVLDTLDGAKVAAASRVSAGGAIHIRPPSLKFPTYHHTEATWTLLVVYGSPTEQIASWTRLDEIIAAIAPSLDVTVATPSSFEGKPPIPAYELTFTD